MMSVNHFRSLSCERDNGACEQDFFQSDINFGGQTCEPLGLDAMMDKPNMDTDPLMPNVIRQDSYNNRMVLEDLDLGENPFSEELINDVLKEMDANSMSPNSPPNVSTHQKTIRLGIDDQIAPESSANFKAPIRIEYVARAPSATPSVQRTAFGVAVKPPVKKTSAKSVSSRKRRCDTPDDDESDTESVDSRMTSASTSTRLTKRTGNSGSKQAAYAREYRQKNRQFLDSLEAKINQLTADNRKLRHSKDKQAEEVVELKNEVQYLRSVLANDSKLAGLISAVQNVQGAKFQFPSPVNTHDYPPPPAKKGRRVTRSSPGVCLHVKDDSISVELCAKCNDHTRCVD